MFGLLVNLFTCLLNFKQMKKVFLFLAEGFEETEAITTADILKRAGMELLLVSVTGVKMVTGAHGIPVIADTLFEETDFSGGDILVLPGGMPGTKNLDAHTGLKELIKTYDDHGKIVAAICAAPMILGEMGLLKGKKATCYPGFESYLSGATVVDERAVVSGNIITGKGPGAAVEFALAIVECVQGEMFAGRVADAFIV
jgi:4-methyl-5(b-hydroxyethyl)-thiazole monophosphate biosynthesis